MRRLGSWVAFSSVAVIALLYSACGGGDNSSGNGDDGGSESGSSSGVSSSGSSSGKGGSSGSGSSGASSSSSGGDGGGVTGASVLGFHKNPNRDGFYFDAALKKSSISTMHLDPKFTATTSSQQYSQVLFMEGGVKGKDALYVATEANDVFALDATTGAQLWMKNLGQNVPQGALDCGNIDPLGSTGTPVIDPASRTLFFAGVVNVNGQPHHQVFSLSVDTGAINWTLDIQTTISGFDTKIQSQRAALLFLGGKLFVPYGGLDGDCGNYKGRVIAIPPNNPSSATGWATGAPSGGGIWGPSGIASDGTSLFVATGNINGADPNWANNNTEAIIKLSTAPAFSGQSTDYFAPSDWYTNLDMNDADLGSSGVVLFDAPMANPSHLAFAMGKSSVARLLDRTNLGGVSDGLSNLGGNGQAFGPMFAYTTAMGTYVGVSQTFNNCNGDFEVLKVSNTAQLSVAWCAGSGGGGGAISSSTSADGSTDSIVWTFGSNDGTLRAWDADTGASLNLPMVNGVNGNFQHWLSPIIAKGRIYMAGDGAVYAFTL